MTKRFKNIIKDFIHHIDSLDAEDDLPGKGFNGEYMMLRSIQNENMLSNVFSYEVGKKPENVKKNRYKDILPRDDRRVKLHIIGGDENSDYINATYIKALDGKKAYIATQGPIPSTVDDFWRMLWQGKTEIVFMACKLVEENKVKCEKYWPDVKSSAVFGSITVHNVSEKEVDDQLIKRKLQAEKGTKSITLTQFMYTGWPDHNTPSSPDVLYHLIEIVRKSRKKPEVPMVVHCSAGCGRTGTVCTVDYTWNLVESELLDENFTVFNLVKSLREQRTSMIQTPDQYRYANLTIRKICKRWLKAETNHIYENVLDLPPATGPAADSSHKNMDSSEKARSKKTNEETPPSHRVNTDKSCVKGNLRSSKSVKVKKQPDKGKANTPVKIKKQANKGESHSKLSTVVEDDGPQLPARTYRNDDTMLNYSCYSGDDNGPHLQARVHRDEDTGCILGFHSSDDEGPELPARKYTNDARLINHQDVVFDE